MARRFKPRYEPGYRAFAASPQGEGRNRCDRTGHEIDLIIEEAGRLYPVEIKSGQTVSADMLAGLHWWCKLSGQPLESATLVHGADERYIRSGVAVRPWYGV